MALTCRWRSRPQHQKRTFTLVLQTAIKVLTICIAEKAMAVSDYSAFANMERGGWSDTARASGYVKLFASASDQAIGSLLDAVGAQRNFRSLDLCCGQGNVSEALLSRGCEVVGIDFSPAMLAFARGRAPKATFIEGDAQALPFDDAEFDIVVSNLGVCHVPDQPRTLAEARRVLRPGGKFAMTVWCGPDTSPCFAAVYGAIKNSRSSGRIRPVGAGLPSVCATKCGCEAFIGGRIFQYRCNDARLRMEPQRTGRSVRDLCERDRSRGNAAQ